MSVEQIRELREATGAGMMDCRRALEEAGGDLQEAIDILRKKGFDQAAKRAGRETGNGVVEAYLHRTSEDYPPQMGALVELNCETDFVAKGPEFRRLARELAMHVTAANPRYVSREDVPSEVVDEERAQLRRRAEQNGGNGVPTQEEIEGQLQVFFKETCLLEQPYFREPERVVSDLVVEAISRLQENITVRRFSRFSIKEG
ncbi:MAG: elongation factor Ts [Candidatus Dormibacteraeota bacterium]|nr:elongation factor Ts [Candidatus Dormibacteraeota bacterium]